MSPAALSLGKYRALQRCSTADGIVAVLALDHQDALKRALNPQQPASVTAADLTRFKLDVVSRLSPQVSGVLLDPVYGASQAVAAGVLAQAGLLVELEKADYQMNPLPLDVEIDPDWSVEKIKRMGADGVKLFYYYNPANDDHAARQDAVIRQVAESCLHCDIPLYAEPIFYPMQPGDPKRPGVIGAAQRGAAAGADILKLEFPVDTNEETSVAIWEEACAEITAAVDVPWVLLSAGVPFDVFAQQLEIACRAGASGFIVGRALWGEAAGIAEVERRRAWLMDEGCRRLQTLNTIAGQYARPWTACYAAPQVAPGWFKMYEGLFSDG